MRSLSGPASPKPLIASRTRRGLSSASRSSPSPSRSITPGRKFSTSTSAQRTSASTNARSCGSFKSMATLRLPRLTDKKYVLSAPSPAGTNGGPQCLVSSPDPGRSTLITSAPRSPSSIAAYGPASTLASSSTCTPARGPSGPFRSPTGPARAAGSPADPPADRPAADGPAPADRPAPASSPGRGEGWVTAIASFPARAASRRSCPAWPRQARPRWAWAADAWTAGAWTAGAWTAGAWTAGVWAAGVWAAARRKRSGGARPGGWLRRRCRERARRHHGDLRLHARCRGLEGAVRAERVVVLVVVEAAARPLVIDLRPGLQELQARRVRVARGARRVRHLAHVAGDRGAVRGLRVLVGQREGDDSVIGVVRVGQRAGRLLAGVELVELVGEGGRRLTGDGCP